MMSKDPKHLLFVHPGQASASPVIDMLTRKMAGAWQTREVGKAEFRGFHRCTGCRARSDSRDHFVTTVDGGRLETNSLAVHYLAYHRADVSEDELAKVARLQADEAEPTTAQLANDPWPPAYAAKRSRSRDP